MHQAWPILDCSRDRKADSERKRERKTERDTEKVTMTFSPCLCMSAYFKRHCVLKWLYSRSHTPVSLFADFTVPLITVPWRSLRALILAAGFQTDIFAVGLSTQNLEVLLDTLWGRWWCDVQLRVSVGGLGRKRGVIQHQFWAPAHCRRVGVFSNSTAVETGSNEETSPSQSAPVCPSLQTAVSPPQYWSVPCFNGVKVRTTLSCIV